MSKSLIPTTVRYLGENGSAQDLFVANRVLTIGALYHVVRMEMGMWHTDVWLHEVPGIAFNSVLFERVDND